MTSSADEFVWIDSYNRLVELQKLPWTHTDLCKAICQRTSMQESEVIGADLLSRLSYYLQRALVRISREAQRLAKSIGKCGKQEISSALKIVLSPACKYRLKFVKDELQTFQKKNYICRHCRYDMYSHCLYMDLDGKKLATSNLPFQGFEGFI